MKRSRSDYSSPRSRSPSPSPSPSPDALSSSHAALRVPVTPTKAAAMKEFASPLRRRQSSGGAAAAAAATATATATAASSMLPPPPSPLKTGGQQQQQQQQQRVPLSRRQEGARPNGDANHQSATTSFQSPSKRSSSFSRGPRSGKAGPSASTGAGAGLAISSPPRVVTAGGAMRVLTPAKAAAARNAGGGKRRHVSGEGGDSTQLQLLSSSNSSKENDLPSSAAAHLPSDGSSGETAAVSGGGGKSDGFAARNRFGAARRVSSHSSGSGDRLADDEDDSSDDDDGGGVLPGRVVVAPAVTTAAAAAAARPAFGPARVNAGHRSSAAATAAAAADRRASAASSRRVRRVGSGRGGAGAGASVGTEAGEPQRSVARRSSSSSKGAGPGGSEGAGSSWGAVAAAADLRNDPRRVSTWSNNSGGSSSSSSGSSIGGGEHAGRRSVSRPIGTRQRNSSTGGSSTASEDASTAALSSASNASSAKRKLTGAAGRVRDRSTSSGGGEGLARRRASAGRCLAGTCEECGKGKGDKRGEEGELPLCEDCAADSAEHEAERQRVVAKRAAGRRSGVAAAAVRRRSAVPPAATDAAGGGGSGGAVEGRDLGRRMCIQDFQVTSKLGMGKFGIVYKAKSKQSHKTVAIKVIYKSSLRDGNYQDAVNLDRERRLQANLSHPNIVGIQNSFQDPKFVYLVLDFASGGDVYKVLSQERHKSGLPHEVAAAYLHDAASAVDYLHRMHVMHRDLKAENLLVDSKGRLQLSDFGWAVHAKPPHQHIRRTMCGTPEYAPPEILVRHPEYTKAVDVWSLGVLAFELLTGQTPFSRAHPSPQAAADCKNDGGGTQTPLSPNDGSSPTATGVQSAETAAAVTAAEVEEIHKGDDHAKLYGRIAGWRGSRDSLFGMGTRGSGAPELARDVVMAMLRPMPGDRLEAGEVLKLPWVALRGKVATTTTT